MRAADGPERLRAVAFAAGLAALFCSGSYLLLGDVGFHLGDEGYLWYGVRRTVEGAVPMRDFQAYEPGRYHWCAALAAVFGDGILGVRAAAACFQIVGLTFALLVAGRFARGRIELAFIALLLGLWMFPNHKLFEPSLAASATWFAVRLCERPSRARHFAAGAWAGLAGFFGPNHALYAAVASGLLILLLTVKERAADPWKRTGAWAAGGLAGYAPMLAMLLLVPGFAGGFLYCLLPRFQHGSNLPLPYPWPWRTDWDGLGGWQLASQVGIAAAFLLPCLLLPAGLARAVLASPQVLREQAALAGSAFVAGAYLHHVAVRSDVSHFAESSPPLLLLALGLTSRLERWPRWISRAALAVTTLLVVAREHPELSRFAPGGDHRTLVEFDAGGEVVRVSPAQATYLENLRAFVRAHLADEESIFIAPNRPTLYALLGKVSPSWWIYFFWPATDEEQRELIEALSKRGVDWVLIIDRPIDGRDDLRFRSTHPLVWSYLSLAFEHVEVPELPGSNQFFRRKEKG